MVIIQKKMSMISRKITVEVHVMFCNASASINQLPQTIMNIYRSSNSLEESYRNQNQIGFSKIISMESCFLSGMMSYSIAGLDESRFSC